MVYYKKLSKSAVAALLYSLLFQPCVWEIKRTFKQVENIKIILAKLRYISQLIAECISFFTVSIVLGIVAWIVALNYCLTPLRNDETHYNNPIDRFLFIFRHARLVADKTTDDQYNARIRSMVFELFEQQSGGYVALMLESDIRCCEFSLLLNKEAPS